MDEEVEEILLLTQDWTVNDEASGIIDNRNPYLASLIASTSLKILLDAILQKLYEENGFVGPFWLIKPTHSQMPSESRKMQTQRTRNRRK